MLYENTTKSSHKILISFFHIILKAVSRYNWFVCAYQNDLALNIFMCILNILLRGGKFFYLKIGLVSTGLIFLAVWREGYFCTRLYTDKTQQLKLYIIVPISCLYSFIPTSWLSFEIVFCFPLFWAQVIFLFLSSLSHFSNASWTSIS